MRVLLWQTAFLGDVILATPLVRTLLSHGHSVTFAGKPFIRDLFKGWDIELLPFSKGLWESFRVVGKLKSYDAAVVPHRSLRTALIMLASGIPMRIGFDRSELKQAYTHVVKHRWDMHEVERNLELLRPLGVTEFIYETYLPLEEEEKRKTLEKFGLTGDDYIVINPFSNFALKEWSLDNWKSLMNKLGHRFVVTGLPEDREKADRLAEGTEFINLVGKTSLRELMAVISGAKLVISNDSSPVHIANALGVPAFTIYTATSSHYGFSPILGSYVNNPAGCSPCSPNPKRCPRRTKECLRLPSPEFVLEVLKELL